MLPTSLCIMVTRPGFAGEELCHLLEAQGDKAIWFSTIDFVPPKDNVHFQQIIQSLGEQDWLIFNSPQAVYASVPAIRGAWPDFPPQVKFAAVGGGTAQALKKAGYLAIFPEEEWSSEGLLSLPEFQTLQDKKIAIIRGEGGREYLEKKLVERGAKVETLIAYRRVLPNVDSSPYLAYVKENKIDAIVCTSFEGVQNLKTLIGDEAWPDLQLIPLIVVSERIKMLARDLGFRTIWVANNAKHDRILDLLEQKRNELWQIKMNHQKSN